MSNVTHPMHSLPKLESSPTIVSDTRRKVDVRAREGRRRGS